MPRNKSATGTYGLARYQETECAQRLKFIFQIPGGREVLYDKLQYLRTSASKNVREMLREDLEGTSRPVPHGPCLTTFDSRDDGSDSTRNSACHTGNFESCKTRSPYRYEHCASCPTTKILLPFSAKCESAAMPQRATGLWW
jgi:hypothetical protein